MNDLNKNSLLEKYKISQKDVGSLYFQIISLHFLIKKLSFHLSNNIHDFETKKRLLKKVARKKKFLSIIKNKDIVKFNELTKDLKAVNK